MLGVTEEIIAIMYTLFGIVWSVEIGDGTAQFVVVVPVECFSACHT